MTITQQIINKLTIKSVYRLMKHLKAEPKIVDHDVIEGITVCHHGRKRKLYYYQDGHNFMCFTHCGNMSIVNFIEHHFDYNYGQAIHYLKDFFNVNNFQENGFVADEVEKEDISIPSDDIQKYFKKDNNIEENKIQPISNNILNSFYHEYPQSWLNEHITERSMDKFNIRFDILNHRIIIPTYRSDGKLIGIRCRDIDRTRLSQGGSKYYPIVFDGKVLRWPTGSSLYALNLNQKNIKNNKKAILFEGEKSVLKLDGYLGDNNISVALFGSNFTKIQKKLLLDLGVNEIIVALDKEFKNDYDDESKLYAKKIFSMVRDIRMQCQVSVIWDKFGLLKYKDSPIDEGFDVFSKLIQNRIML